MLKNLQKCKTSQYLKGKNQLYLHQSSRIIYTTTRFLQLCVSQCSPETEPMGCTHTFIYYKKLVHAITEAEKTPDLPSVSWKPRRAGGAVPVQVCGAEN